RRAVTLNRNRFSAQRVANKITYRKVSVQGKMRSAKGPAARDHTLDTLRLLIEGAHELGCAFPLCIDATRIERVGRSRVGFGKMRDGRRLPAIYRAGARQQETGCAMRSRELKRSLGPCEYCRKHLHRCF